MEDNIKKECAESSSLRWLSNNFPFIENPKTDVDRMGNCIHAYSLAGAVKIEELLRENERLEKLYRRLLQSH